MKLCVFHNNKKDRESAISTQSPKASDTASLNRLFIVKACGAQAVLCVENALPYLIAPTYVAGIYLTSVFAGAVQMLAHPDRKSAVIAAAVAALAPLPFIAWKRPWRTSFNDALKRLDQNLGDPNIPAQMLGSEKVTGSKEAWQSYRERLLHSKVNQFRIGWPAPAIPRYVMAAGLAIAAALPISAWYAGPERSSLLREAFNFHAPVIPPPPPDVRAWVSAPEGIESAQPLPLSNLNANKPEAGAVHKGSILHISILNGLADIKVDGVTIDVDAAIADSNTTQYKPVTFSTDGIHTVQVLNGPTWTIRVEPDAAPEIVITGAGGDGDKQLGLRCIAKDDFGIINGSVDMEIIGANPEATPPQQAQLPSLPLEGATLCQPKPGR
jgi:hypothetical protein